MPNCFPKWPKFCNPTKNESWELGIYVRTFFSPKFHFNSAFCHKPFCSAKNTIRHRVLISSFKDYLSHKLCDQVHKMNIFFIKCNIYPSYNWQYLQTRQTYFLKVSVIYSHDFWGFERIVFFFFNFSYHIIFQEMQSVYNQYKQNTNCYIGKLAFDIHM